MKNIKPQRVTDSNEFLLQGSTELKVGSWNLAAKDSFLKREFMKVFKKNQDTKKYFEPSKTFKSRNDYFIGYLPEGEPEPFYADLIF